MIETLFLKINNTLGARISTSINLKVARLNIWNGTIRFKAYALMDCFKSWVRPGYANEYNLQHEQTHFNLTEMCVRGLETELESDENKVGKIAYSASHFR